MALTSGSLVYFNVCGGLMPYPPLIGNVDFTNGQSPDVVRVNWDNCGQQTFDTVTQSLNRLVDFTDVTASLGDAHPLYGTNSTVVRVMSSSINGIKKLVLTANGFYVLV